MGKHHSRHDRAEDAATAAPPAASAAPPAASAAPPAASTALAPQKKAASPSVAIIYYSMYGHILTVAREIKAGLEAKGANVDLFQIEELLPPSVLSKMGAPPKPADVMTINHEFLQKLPEYDGLLFGFPTRFGMMAGQMKMFLDGMGSLWQQGKLIGKPVGSFVSTGTQQGGQETTHMTALTNFVHQGMMYVPLGYRAGDIGQFDLSEIKGGSPWGASTLAGGDGSRQPSSAELAIARRQGELFAGTVAQVVSPNTKRKCKICIVYYSMYGHVKKLADRIADSARAAGVDVDVFQAEETLSKEVQEKMGAPAKPADPVMDHAAVQKLTDYDGFMFGAPTRFGMMPTQMKAFWDMTGGHWQKGALAGKPAATFVSTGTANGGQETTHFTMATQFVHHGMVYVPLGYAAGAEGQFDMSEVHGGSPWGASTYAGGDGSRQPSAMELAIAAKQGSDFAARVKALAA
jgi:NAD(P)H dehydrogenase (quinone)